MSKKQILFVDDDPAFLHALEETLKGVEPSWSVTFSPRSLEAVGLVQKTPFDVVVADYQMPDLDGVQFLERVQDLQPQAMRFILSGELDRDDLIRLALPVHQCFTKPLDTDLLRRTIRRVCALRELLSNDVLRRLVAQCSQLPTIPSLYLELSKELKSPQSSLDRVEAIICKDPAVTAKILQLVNSSFFGLARKIESLAEAINYVGLHIIKALVLTIPVYSRFDGLRVKDYSPAAIWEHCWRVGVLARAVALEEKQTTEFAEQAFLAGLLHDLGKMVLIANLSTLCRESTALAAKKQIPMHQAEREIFGCTHALIAAYLLGLWGLPEPIVEAVAFHNEPMESPSNTFSPLSAVHVANALDHAYFEGRPDQFKTHLDLEYIMSLGLAARLDDWQKAGLTAFQRARSASGE